MIAPVLAVVESVGAIVDALGDPDFLGAVNELITSGRGMAKSASARGAN